MPKTKPENIDSEAAAFVARLDRFLVAYEARTEDTIARGATHTAAAEKQSAVVSAMAEKALTLLEAQEKRDVERAVDRLKSRASDEEREKYFKAAEEERRAWKKEEHDAVMQAIKDGKLTVVIAEGGIVGTAPFQGAKSELGAAA